MSRRIVVGLDPSDYSKKAVEVAVQRAKLSGAVVVGVAIADLPGIEHAEIGAPAGSIHYAEKAVGHHLTKAQEICTKLLADCEATCQSAGVTFEKEYHTGDPAEVLTEMCYSADVAYMGLRSFFHFQTQEEPGDTLKRLVAARACPVLAVPKEGHFPPERVLLPYDPSPESARALRSFALQASDLPVKDVVLLRVEGSIDEGMRRIKRQVKYLQAWGFNVEARVVPGDPKSVILDMAKDLMPCVVVLGAYNHSPISEIFFGSTTMALISNGKIPLYIAA